MKVFILLTTVILFSSCIKTAEQVQREKKFESISEQMSDSQSLLTGLVTQMKDMQTQIDKLNGKLEELEHSKVNPEEVKKNRETMDLIQSQQETQLSQLSQIQNELKEQRSFIEKVTQKLSNGDIKSDSGKPSQKKSAKSELKEALGLVSKDKFQEARIALTELVDNPGLTTGDQNKLLHGLGRVEYYTKNYDQALVYFSKIFSKYPQASLAPSSLLYIGRTLNKLGKKDEATEALKKVIEDYSETNEAKEAKKEL